MWISVVCVAGPGLALSCMSSNSFMYPNNIGDEGVSAWFGHASELFAGAL